MKGRIEKQDYYLEEGVGQREFYMEDSCKIKIRMIQYGVIVKVVGVKPYRVRVTRGSRERGPGHTSNRRKKNLLAQWAWLSG